VSFKNLFSVREEPAELSQVKAGDGLHFVVGLRVEACVDNSLDQVEVLLFVEHDEVLLPELLSMAWTPSELSSVNLVPQFIDRAEHLLVGIEEIEELLEQLVDVLVDPVAVLELDNEAESINVRHVLLAD
jgi:hypothetical protein